MGVSYVDRLVLKVTKLDARKRLTKLSARGERLVARLRRYEEGSRREAQEDYGLWYSACINQLSQIFPTKTALEQLDRAMRKPPSHSERAQSGVDVLQDLLDTLENYNEPPLQHRIVDFLKGSRTFALADRAVFVAVGGVLHAYGDKLISLLFGVKPILS